MPSVIDLSKRSRIKVSGAGALDFLQSMCTNDVKALAQGRGLPAAFLDRFGKVLAVSSIYNLGDWFLVESDLLAHAKLLAYLTENAKLANCEIADLRDEYKMFSVTGFGESFMDLKLEKNQIIQKQLGPGIALITKNCFLNRLDFFIPVESSDGFPEFLYRKEGAEQVSAEEYESFRVDQGVPEFGKDFDEGYMVLELGLDNLISYTKGCYTGQEVVVRMKAYQGQLARKIVRIKVDSTVNRKDKLFKEQQEVGIITSIGKLGVATVKKGFFDSGNKLQNSSGIGVVIL